MRGWPWLFLLLLTAAPPLEAQGFVGPDKCLKCHKKLAGPAWKLHRESAAQLDPAKKPNASRYAAAAGGNPQADACKRCHAPDLAAAPPTVSCETCHGPGKGYLDPHQERPFYDGGNQMGMLVLFNQAGKIAQQCTRCHVLTTEHKAIADLGHPTGDDFKMGAAFEKIKHWPSGAEKDVRVRAYTGAFLAEIEKAGAPLIQKALKGTKPSGVPAAAAGVPPAGAPSGGAPSGGAPRATAARAAAAPSGNVLASLLDDLRQEGVEVRSAKLADEPVAEFAPTVAPPPRPASANAESATAGRESSAAPAGQSRVPAAKSTLKAGDVFELRGQAAARLQELLKKKAKLEIKPPAPPARFSGPDGELLTLQDQVMALALEALLKLETVKKEP